MTCPTCTDAWHSIEFMVWHVLLFIAHVSILLKNDTLCGIMLGMYQRLSTYRPTLYWHIYVLVSMRRSNCYCWNSSWKTCVPQWLDNLSDRHDTNKGGEKAKHFTNFDYIWLPIANPDISRRKIPDLPNQCERQSWPTISSHVLVGHPRFFCNTHSRKARNPTVFCLVNLKYTTPQKKTEFPLLARANSRPGKP